MFLGVIAVAYPHFVGRRLAVSGAWERVVHWRSEAEIERADAIFHDETALEAALAEATLAEFGEPMTVTETVVDFADATLTGRMPLATQATLLVSIFVGGLVSALTMGRFEIRGDMGPAFSEIVVDGPLMWPTLFVGGVLVGLGTRMAGGCSSGHGLSGCGRLQPVSLLATSVFFGTAAVTSILLWKVI